MKLQGTLKGDNGLLVIVALDLNLIPGGHVVASAEVTAEGLPGLIGPAGPQGPAGPRGPAGNPAPVFTGVNPPNGVEIQSNT